MTSSYSIDKRPNTNRQWRGNSGPPQVFRPLSPFAASESGEEDKLPDWARRSRVQLRPKDRATYNFDWISSPDPERSNLSAARTHGKPQKSSPSPEIKMVPGEPTRSDNANDTYTETSISTETIAEDGDADLMKNEDPLAPAIQHITESTPGNTLKIARSLAQDGKMQEALGHYLCLVKLDQKLKHVIADLEAHRANPHMKQTPLMLQALADAYTKTGKLSKAMPLYRQALGR